MFKKTNVRVSTAFNTIPGVFFFFSVTSFIMDLEVLLLI